jgi:hypothetical protein
MNSNTTRNQVEVSMVLQNHQPPKLLTQRSITHQALPLLPIPESMDHKGYS